MDRRIEEGLLQKSHTPEEAKELLDSRYSLSGEQKPFLVLTPTSGGNNASVPKAKKGLDHDELMTNPNLRVNKHKQRKRRIRRARDDLKDFIKENKNNASYASFEGLNTLWKGYMADLLSGTSNAQVIAGKLASADYHGADLTVVEARNPSLVGINGIVVWEARTGFVMVCRDNKLRIVEKRGARFDVNALPDKKFEIIGSRFLYRTAERSGRKFKPKSVEDL
ncbi:hypothetical protein TRICI_001221 [Trichomonascus ciferrii]|uniref:Ribonuclease P protein subunit n=1 Tax=Trichomonascus ciferrii TaxID=44093 RepID=A0A642VCI8_9ASCO|nr:hypothetical protein TRICI_001221 [Trichomonascus ciferrii]